MAPRSTPAPRARVLAALLLLVLLVASSAAESETYLRCKSAYEAAGGDAGLIKRVPSCVATDPAAFMANFSKCCGALTSGQRSAERRR